MRTIDEELIEAQITIEDPAALTAPWHVTKQYRKLPEGTFVYDYACTENNRNPVDTETGRTLTLGPNRRAPQGGQGRAVSRRTLLWHAVSRQPQDHFIVPPRDAG